MLLVQGNDGAFYGEPCVQLPNGEYVGMGENGCVITLPKRRARSPEGAIKAGRRLAKSLGLSVQIDEVGVSLVQGGDCGKAGWVIPFVLTDWIDYTRFEYRCRTGFPSLSTPFIAFRVVFGKQVLIDCLGLERVPPLLCQWLTPGPGYIRRNRDDYLALVAALTPLLPNYRKYKSVESYLEACPNQIAIDRRPKPRRVAPKVESVGEPA